MKNEKYNISLDIGTNSVGWAVCNDNNDLFKFRKKNMWGVRLFEEGQTAAQTRKRRSVRRRYARRKERIYLLRQLLSPLVLRRDDSFFIRMDEAFLWKEDKTLPYNHILFNDSNYTDQEYYNSYPTIYHLRKALIDSDKAMDPRLIYLALHHILKYRGHFLYMGQKFETIAGSINETLQELSMLVQEHLGEILLIKDSNCIEIQEILKSKLLARKVKQENIVDILKQNGIEKKYANEVANAMLGYQMDFTYFFKKTDLVDENGKAIKLSLADTKFEEMEEQLQAVLEEQYIIVELFKKIYSWQMLQEILDGCSTLAEAMVKKYTKHQQDLKKLKKLVRQYANQEYSNFFRMQEDEKGGYRKNYVNYIHGDKRCSQEELYKTIKTMFAKVDSREYKEILTDMEERRFLQKINSKENSLIPYQLNEIELVSILKKQGEFYPELIEKLDKIHSIFVFKIPYYIGPMNKDSKFSWIERNNEKIYPWNFNEVVDIDTTAETFITRMTNYCTYLPNEKVIPKYSLLYAKYELLNELNKIRINDKQIDVATKKRIIEELFMNSKNKRVTDNKFRRYLEKILYNNADSYVVTGYQKDGEFASSLTAYIDFTKIIGEINPHNVDMIEEIIYWITVFEEKEIIARKIKSKYNEKINSEQLEKILKLRYTGWSRLSRKLLIGITSCNERQEKVTIIDVLKQTNSNFMQIINNKQYEFKKIIEESNNTLSGEEITLDQVQQLQGSPAIKRGIWQTVQIVEELIKIMGCDPQNIFIEFARNEGEKKRISSREKQLNKCYEKLRSETVQYNDKVGKELKSKKYNKKLNDERVFLYFIQNGRCMYTGEPLDLDMLQQYQVDHIIPQAYIKDDSIENKVLVKTIENQYKTDKLLISVDIRRKQKSYWEYLFRCGLIGAKKYGNLNREGISENEAKGFINRQLVETRQITKHVAVLFNNRYVNTNIITIKAELSHNFRGKFKLYKCRELNDLHHAHDAYIASVIGNYIIRKYNNMQSEFIYGDFKKYYSKAVLNKKNKYGYIISQFDKIAKDFNGIVFWNGMDEIAKVRKVLCYKDCRVTKKLEELTGNFYKETMYPAGGKNAKIPLKKGLDVSKYGGYTGQNIAYSIVVEYTKEGKKLKKLIGIPVYIVALRKQNEKALQDFVAQELGTKEFTIIKDRILKYQLIEEKGNLLYIVSATEVVNGKQLCFESAVAKYMKLLVECKKDIKEEEEKLMMEEELFDFYEYLHQKLCIHYKTFSDSVEKIYNKLHFKDFSFTEKVEVIYELLKLSKIDSSYPNLKKYQLTDRMGRKAKYNLKIEDTLFIDQSITGLYERRYSI